VKIGYARVSTDDQSLDIQIALLKKAGCKKIFEEKRSGVGRDRPQLSRMMASLKKGDVVVVHRLDRLARSTRTFLEIIDSIATTGAKFLSLSEPWADTTSPTGRMVMTVLSGIAEFERDLIQSRTSAGRAAAKSRGVQFGRPQKLTADQKKLIMRLIKEGQPVKEVACTFKVHTATIYRLIDS
jgi:DNA invertase Pin-like site-specific DNA recombinase